MSVGQMARMGMQVCWLVKTAGVSKQVCWSVNQPRQVCRYVIWSYSWGMYANMLSNGWGRFGRYLVSQMAGVGSAVCWLVKTVGYVCRYVGWSKQLG